MSELAELTPGTIFGGYRIERLLGRGGMGAVYAAEQLEDRRRVAVKVLSSGLTRDEDRARFLREGITAASINHPNTVYVYRTEEIDGVPTHHDGTRGRWHAGRESRRARAAARC